jgi:hypothetical protein
MELTSNGYLFIQVELPIFILPKDTKPNVIKRKLFTAKFIYQRISQVL